MVGLPVREVGWGGMVVVNQAMWTGSNLLMSFFSQLVGEMSITQRIARLFAPRVNHKEQWMQVAYNRRN
jgi:hypothetical protein